MKKFLACLIAICAIAAFAVADESPTTSPATTQAAASTQPVISAEAKAVLDQVSSAYANLKSLETTCTVRVDLKIAGQDHVDHTEFTTTFVAPNKFRYEIKDDTIVGSTGEKLYVYRPGDKLYLTAKTPADRENEIPSPFDELISQQNPSLLMAISADAAEVITHGEEKVTRGQDVTIDGVACERLVLESSGGSDEFLIDPNTHLIRRVTQDLSKMMARRGTTDVEKAELIVDYTRTLIDGKIDPSQFAWTPPANAREASGTDSDKDSSPASSLVGQAAPDFSLEDLAGNKVSLADQKGKIVVIDFWATWCPPCRVSLPHLDKAMEDYAPKGAAFFAINVNEKKEAVEKFVKSKEMKVPVLLDEDGKISEQYKVQGIPATFIIGRDGKIVASIVGFDPQNGDKKLRGAIEKAIQSKD